MTTMNQTTNVGNVGERGEAPVVSVGALGKGRFCWAVWRCLEDAEAVRDPATFVEPMATGIELGRELAEAAARDAAPAARPISRRFGSIYPGMARIHAGRGEVVSVGALGKGRFSWAVWRSVEDAATSLGCYPKEAFVDPVVSGTEKSREEAEAAALAAAPAATTTSRCYAARYPRMARLRREETTNAEKLARSFIALARDTSERGSRTLERAIALIKATDRARLAAVFSSPLPEGRSAEGSRVRGNVSIGLLDKLIERLPCAEAKDGNSTNAPVLDLSAYRRARQGVPER